MPLAADRRALAHESARTHDLEDELGAAFLEYFDLHAPADDEVEVGGKVSLPVERGSLADGPTPPQMFCRHEDTGGVGVHVPGFGG